MTQWVSSYRQSTLIGENIELVRKIAGNSDNIDYGEIIYVHDGSEEGITT